MRDSSRYLALGVLSAIIFLAGCVSRGDYQALEEEMGNQARVIRNLKKYNYDLERKYNRAVSDDPLREEELEKLRRELGVLREQNEKYAKLSGEWDKVKKGFNQADWKGVSIEKWGIRVKDAVLFASGQHKLKAGGMDALRAIASSLRGLKIRIEGHTDTDKVLHSRKRYPYGNLQLSGERALEVAHFLITECGLDPNNVSYSGIGEHEPVVPNDTPEGKAKNRRVDIRALEVSKVKP